MNYLIQMELRRSLLQLCRYPIETAVSFLILAGMFFGIAYGTHVAFGKSVPSNHVASVTLVSYMAWMLCMILVSGPAAELEAEAQNGTIEQLFSGKLSLTRILTARMVASIVVTVAPVTLAIGWFEPLQLQVTTLLCVALTVVTAAGGGFALAGAALLVKKTRAIVLLATLGLMPVMMTNDSASWVQHGLPALLVPFLGPIGLAKTTLLMPAQWTWSAFGVTAVASLLYLLVGIALFNAMRRRAMHLGTIGYY